MRAESLLKHQMAIAKDFYLKNGDTGISLVEITERGKVIHFINNSSHLDIGI
jgi:2,3-bisphosphoglycerate-dependent phosphoglycerate mutase